VTAQPPGRKGKTMFYQLIDFITVLVCFGYALLWHSYLPNSLYMAIERQKKTARKQYQAQIQILEIGSKPKA